MALEANVDFIGRSFFENFPNTCLIIFYFQHFMQVCFYFLGKKLGGGARAPPAPPLATALLQSIIDKRAPWPKRFMTQRARAPWLSDEIRSAKRHRRIAERNWRSTKSESDRRTFQLLRNKAVFLVNKSRWKYYTDFINISGDQRKLFAATKKLLNSSAQTPFPPQ